MKLISTRPSNPSDDGNALQVNLKVGLPRETLDHLPKWSRKGTFAVSVSILPGWQVIGVKLIDSLKPACPHQQESCAKNYRAKEELARLSGHVCHDVRNLAKLQVTLCVRERTLFSSFQWVGMMNRTGALCLLSARKKCVR